MLKFYFLKRRVPVAFALCYFILLSFLCSTSYAQSVAGTLDFNAADGTPVAKDGDAGSADIPNIEYQIFTTDVNLVPNGTVLTYYNDIGLGTGGIVGNIDDGDPVIVIKSADGAEFSFEGITTGNRDGIMQRVTFEGFRNGTSTGSVTLDLDFSVTGINTFTKAELSPAIFQSVDEVRLTNPDIPAGASSEVVALGFDELVFGDPVAANSAPTATNLTQSKSATEGGSAIALDDIVVTDPDAGETITATLTLSNTSAGSLSTGTYGSATSTFNAGTGIWTVTGSVADVNAALAAVAFTPSANNDQNFTITTRIRDAAATGPADGAIAFTVTAVNALPIITQGSGTTKFMENSPRAVDNALAISDSDNTTLASATVSISVGFQSDQDILAFTNNGSTMGNISASYNGTSGVLSLTSAGATATLAQWQAALGSVIYDNSSNSPNTTSRTISFVINDGTDNSTAGTKALGVTAVPDITSATYDAYTGVLAVTGTDFKANGGAANDIATYRLSITGEGGETYTFTTGDAEITGSTSFSVSLNSTDKVAVNRIFNKNGTASTSGTSYNLAAGSSWVRAVINTRADLTGNEITVSNVAVPVITSATYDASTGALVVTGTGFLSATGATNDIIANKFSVTGEGGAKYTLTDTENIEITSTTSFTISLSETDKAAVNQILNKNGNSSTGGTNYNIGAAEDWAAGTDVAVVVADNTGNGITVSNVAVPAIVSATYDASTGTLVVTGTGFLSLNGASNDIIANKFSVTGEGGATYTLTDTENIEITSTTSFTISLSETDKAAVNQILNKNGNSSTGGTNYNIGAAEDWAAGTDVTVVVADNTGNGITVSNVAVPAITSATYDASTGSLVVTGTGFLSLNGASNDIIANKFSVTGEGGATYTLTDTENIEITSATSFTITLSETDKAAVNQILNKNGNSSTGGTNYNIGAAEDWAAGTDVAVLVADNTGNGITVSNVDSTPPAVSSVGSPSPDGTYKIGDAISTQMIFNEAVTVTGTPQITLETGPTDRVINYSSGSGSNTLTFSYTVQAGDISADLDYTATSALALNGGTIRDMAGNNATLTLPAPGAANSLANSKNIVVDGVAPSVSSITRLTSAATNASSLDFRVTFSENVTGVDVTDFSITKIGTADATVASITQVDASTYTVALNGVSGDGIIRLNLNSTGTGIMDAPGNAVSSGYTAGQTYTVDHTAPTVNSVGVPANATYIANQHLDFTINFGENITVNTGGGTPRIGLTLNTGGTVYAYYLAGSGTSALTFRYTVVAGNLDTDGIEVGALADNGGTLKDAAGNNATLTLNSVGSVTAVLVDAAVPTASIVFSDTALKIGETSLVTITFSEAVSGFDNTDLTIANGTLSAVSSTDDIIWTATFTPTANITEASNLISLANTGVTDLAGNAGSGTTSSNYYVIDTNSPTLAITSNVATLKAAETATITFTFSEDPEATFDATDITVSGGTLGALAGTETSRTATFTPTSNTNNGTASITVGAGAYTDAAGNAGGGGASPSLTFDTAVPAAPSAPNLASSSDSGPSTTDNITNDATPALIGMAESGSAVTLYDTDGTTVLGTATANGTGNWLITSSALSQGTHTLTMKATDAAGNISSASSGLSVTIDTSAPAAAVVAAPANGATITTATPAISGTAEANATVTVYIDGSSVSSSVAVNGSGNWTYSVGSALSDGSHTFSATATDIAGNTGASSGVNTVTVNTLPTISATSALTTLTAVYGATSASETFTISATNLAEGILVTPPSGFEVSTDNTTFNGSLTFGGAGNVSATTVYVRLTNTADAGNHTGNISLTSAGATAVNVPMHPVNTVDKAVLTVSATGNNKEYNGSDAATVTLGDNRVPGDVLTLNYTTATFGNKNAGTGKAISVSGISISGTDAGNYTFNTTATTSADITAKALTVTATGNNKAYDGSTTATVILGDNRVSGDVLTLNYTTAAFDTKNTGTGKPVSVSGISISGTDAGNYTVNATVTTTAEIMTKALTISATGINKEYDGSNKATVTLSDDRVSGDVLTTAYAAASFDTKNAGTGKPVSVSGISISGTDAGNYTFNSTQTTAATITAKVLIITADNKQRFVGTANPELTVSYTGFINGEDSNILSMRPVVTTTATRSSGLGEYPITVRGASSANYDISYREGIMKVVAGAPTSVSLATIILFENRPAGTAAGTLGSTSDDPAATFSYSLVSGAGDTDNDLFAIRGDELQTAASLNYEQKDHYSIRVRSTTQYGFSLDQVFTIHIGDVNEAPSFSAIADETICYTTAPMVIQIGKVSAGPEADQAVQLTVSTDHRNLFQQLGVNNAGKLVYQVKEGMSGVAWITVNVRDNGGVANGGEDSFAQTFKLAVNPLPVITITSDKGTSISKGETVQLTATGGNAYSWADAEGITGSRKMQTLTVRPSVTTTYRVQVTTDAGCQAEKEITIEVKDDYQVVRGTNLVSPNGDGVNDRLIIRNIDMYPNNVVKIYDRGGRLLYSKSNYTNEWDGTFQGSPLAEGTYYYIVDFGQRQLKGFITIVRD